MPENILENKAERKSVARAATVVAALTSPIVVIGLTRQGVAPGWAIVLALLGIAAFRGLVDLLFRGLVSQPDLFGTDDQELRDEDALRRRRIYFWSRKVRLVCWLAAIVTFLWIKRGGSWWGNAVWIYDGIMNIMANPQTIMYAAFMPLFFLMNFVILFGPLMAMGVSQIRGFEPGDADWGVKLDDVRGQKEAKEEISKVITLWQSGARFVKAGGKRERGLLFLGAPGTGKTMLAKAIATNFNSPVVTCPGSGFAQAFMGMDIVIVRWMARKAKKLASKWGNQCIVFIDEIDAVGMRRSSLGGAEGFVRNQIPGGMMGGMMGGMAINQLLVVMDGIDSPPFFRRFLTSKINLYLDVLYIIPAKISIPWPML